MQLHEKTKNFILQFLTGYEDENLFRGFRIGYTADRELFPRYDTPYCACFSGAPDENIVLSDKVSVRSKNERISLTLLPVGEEGLKDAKEFVLTAMGTTGMDETAYNPGPEMMGLPFTSVEFKGKLYAETLEGTLHVKVKDAMLQILNPVGEILSEMDGERNGENICFTLNGEIPAVQYHLIIKE